MKAQEEDFEDDDEDLPAKKTPEKGKRGRKKRRDDDQDEDVLYLRLMAMRSILNEALSSPKETDESEELADESEVLADETDEMVNEMAELLDEVDQAADGESQEPLDQSPMDIAAVIEKMHKCKNAAKKQNAGEEEEELGCPGGVLGTSPIADGEEDGGAEADLGGGDGNDA